MTEFTGERVIPGQVNVDLWNEHISRYAFAARYAPGKRVLDLGCGTGYGAAALASTATHVTALDLSGDALAYARTNFPLSNVEWIEASCASIPCPAAAFDLITAFEVIEHLSDRTTLIAEAARVLRPDGMFVVSTPNSLYYAESRINEGPNPFHEHEYEFEEFAAELRHAFPHVIVLLQNRTECLAFYPHKTFPIAEASIPAASGSPEDANFFVAVCSHKSLPEIRGFAYVPRAANLLREREQHIQKLDGELAMNQQWLADVRADRQKLIDYVNQQKEHIEEHNRWALELERLHKGAQERVAQLQEELQVQQRSAINVMAQYELKISDLEQNSQAVTQRAAGVIAGLTDEVENERAAHAATIQRLSESETLVEERSRWALDLQAQLEQLEATLAAVRKSRWLALGGTLGVGPKL